MYISHFLAILWILYKYCVFIKSLHLYLSTEVDLVVFNGPALPNGTKTLSSEHAKLDIDLEVAAGDASSYPGNAHDSK